MDIIRVIGDYLELDGIRVAKVLEIDASTRSKLEEYINYSNDYKKVEEAANSLQEDLVHQEIIANKAYSEGKADGYAEGKADG
jgi:hypothetical protein